MQEELAGMEAKLEKVASWLKKTFGDQPIPPYEADARTVDILYELAECNESRDGDVRLLIEDMKQKAVEYESDGTFLQDLLTESLNLSFSNMSKGSTSYLNTLVDTALALETKDTSLASFIPAINDLTSELDAAESKNKEMELELSTLRKKLTSALVLEKRLQDDLKKTEELLVVEKAKADNRTQNMKFLKDKVEDFKFRIKAAEKSLLAPLSWVSSYLLAGTIIYVWDGCFTDSRVSGESLRESSGIKEAGSTFEEETGVVSGPDP
uniref:HAUS augmin-like complex subunit 1 isoform X2 n=1 Tax=Podarcis muralis TaxID=64176 RepID=UPI00109F9CD4|nr:HAUS augmin-like complex subunit 1 isoform X2 [Podarcis muralis]